jgi:hypothetical protein
MECLAIFIAYILMLCFLTFPYGITTYIAFILMECLAIFIAYIPMQYFLTILYGITIYIAFIHMQCFLTFSYGILKPQIYIFFKFFRVDSC